MTAFLVSPAGILLLKVIVTPLLVLGASLAGRLWGQSIGGWLVGLPLTSGPIAFFLAVDQGTGFVEKMAAGVISGAAAQGGFCVGHAQAARRHAWPWSLAAGLLSYGAIVVLIRSVAIPFNLQAFVAALTLIGCVYAMPHLRQALPANAIHPAWDIPARMAVATILGVGLRAAAPLTGGWLNGVLATIPVFGSGMAVFAHRNYGADSAINLLTGFLLGAFAVIGFFFVLANVIALSRVPLSFAAAIVAALAVQGITLQTLQRSTKI